MPIVTVLLNIIGVNFKNNFKKFQKLQKISDFSKLPVWKKSIGEYWIQYFFRSKVLEIREKNTGSNTYQYFFSYGFSAVIKISNPKKTSTKNPNRFSRLKEILAAQNSRKLRNFQVSASRSRMRLVRRGPSSARASSLKSPYPSSEIQSNSSRLVLFSYESNFTITHTFHNK